MLLTQDKHYPISLHELTACIYYKLAIDRGLRGCSPEGECEAHSAASARKYCEHNNDDDDYYGKASDSELDCIMRSTE
jgi:hypothetical protein